MEPIPLAPLLGADLDPNDMRGPLRGLERRGASDRRPRQRSVGWEGWNSYRSNKDDFNRQFIFSLAQDRHDLTLWLFGGVWEVLQRGPEQDARSYKVALRGDRMGPCIRRLYVRWALPSRQRRRKMESVLDEMTVSSILEEPFAGDPPRVSTRSTTRSPTSRWS